MKARLAAVLAAVCVVEAVPEAAAYQPWGWLWFFRPYAYDVARAEWRYFNPSDAQWCYRYGSSGGWVMLSESELTQGWTWWMWPYVYGVGTEAWYYVRESDTQWCYDYGGAQWSRLGTIPDGMGFIPAGTFTMGNPLASSPRNDWPTHSVYVSAFYMDQYEVSKEKWNRVYSWAVAHGYSFYNAGSGKARNHPVHSVNWYDCVAWCNARSEMEGRTPCYMYDGSTYRKVRWGAPDCNWSANGYRLPTEAEWEKAARGGLNGQRYPWGATISHSQANYYAGEGYDYDLSTGGYHPSFYEGEDPYTCPVDMFDPNAYGLYNMAGNVEEWCWDHYGADWYSQSGATQADTTGESLTSSYMGRRVVRSGAFRTYANGVDCADRSHTNPPEEYTWIGFRCVCR